MRVMTYHHKSGTQSSEVHKDNNGDWIVKHHNNGQTKTMNANDADHAHKLAKKLVEDAPVNSAGNGGVQGIGVGPKGEPGGKKAKLIKNILRRRKLSEEERPETLELSVPLFIRLLEFAKEDAKDDYALHIVTENALKADKVLDMNDYDNLTNIPKHKNMKN